jgi:N-acetyl-D-muramate 6-phosphate phosphatase
MRNLRSPLFLPVAVLFDLDGTLADTATDLAAPVNAMRVAQGLTAMPINDLRPYASMGARGLIGKGLGIAKEDARFPALRDEFLARYEKDMCVETKLFDGAHDLLAWLEAHNIAWGVVSNKVERYVRPILRDLGVLERSRCAIGGDTTAYPKPRPEPLLLGATQLNVDPARCWYIGDDRRDIEAAHAAAMFSVAASYGYCGDADPPSAWQAGLIIDSLSDLTRQLQKLSAAAA